MSVTKQIREILDRPHDPSECPSKGMFGADCPNCIRPEKVHPPMILHVQSVMFTEADHPDIKIKDFKPKAKKHHDYELTFPEGTTHKYIPSERLGHYGHNEYHLPNGNMVVVHTMYQEQVAYYRRAGA